jgi:tetratricopeptide (TPR) repeat protein
VRDSLGRMKLFAVARAVLLGTCWVALTQAEPAVSAPEGKAAAATPPAPTPYMQAILRGNAAFLAQDFITAKREYQSAIELDSHRPEAHGLLAELSLQTGALDEALAFAQAAGRFSAGDKAARVRSAQLQAMVWEAKKELEHAKEAWAAYGTILGAGAPSTPAGPHAAVIAARTEALNKALKAQADATAVAARIKAASEAAPKP